MGVSLFTSILTHYMLHKIKSFPPIVLKEYSVIIKMARNDMITIPAGIPPPSHRFNERKMNNFMQGC